MKNLKIGVKLTCGFILVALITLAVGIIGWRGVDNLDGHLTEVGEVRLPSVQSLLDVDAASGDIMMAQRSLLNPRMPMRGYGFTAEKRYLDDAQREIVEVKTSLDNARKLAEQATHLVKLGPAVQEARASVTEYEQLMTDTVNVNARMDTMRERMDQSAGAFVQNTNDFIASQNQAIAREIEANANQTA
jgi:methyl-accepting chemotaxis protein